MPTTLNSFVKQHTPGLHRFLKQALARTNLPVPKLLHGRPIWTHPRLFNHAPSEPRVQQWIADNLRSGDVFFDVGAHHGWMSLIAARTVGTHGKVVAFEPSPPLIDFLSFHKRANHLAQLEIVPKAVTNQGAAQISFSLIDAGDSSMNSLAAITPPETSSRPKSVIPVDTITLDSFSRQSGLIPAMIKIDAEGAEIWICEGANQLLENHHPILIIATHPLWLPAGQKIEDLFQLLARHGYSIIDSVLHPYKGTQFGDYLCIGPQKTSSQL